MVVCFGFVTLCFLIVEKRDTDDIDAVSAAISDVHIGTNNFLEDEWEKMLKWLSRTTRLLKISVILWFRRYCRWRWCLS